MGKKLSDHLDLEVSFDELLDDAREAKTAATPQVRKLPRVRTGIKAGCGGMTQIDPPSLNP